MGKGTPLQDDKLNAVPFEIDGVEKGDQIYAMIVSPRGWSRFQA